MELTYNGYIIEVGDCGYKIIEEISSNKFKVRRKCNTHGKSIGGNRNGKLYKGFRSDHEALINAKNYIDKFIVRWADSPNNPKNNIT